MIAYKCGVTFYKLLTGIVFTHCLNIYGKPGENIDLEVSTFIHFAEHGYIRGSHKFLSENNNANESIELLKLANAVKKDVRIRSEAIRWI